MIFFWHALALAPAKLPPWLFWLCTKHT